MNKFMQTKKSGWYVEACALILAIITTICYVARNGNYLSPVSGLAVAMLVIGIVINALVLYKDLISLAVLLNTEMLYISNVFFGVDGNVFDVAFFIFVICDILAVITSIVGFSIGLSKEDK